MPRNNYKRKSRKNNESRTQSKKGRDYTKEGSNDASWYMVSGQLAKDVASISFNNANGLIYTLDPSRTDSDLAFTVPGIMNIYLAPVPGWAMSGSDCVNVAAQNLYSWVRYANSGHANYEPADLMNYLLAVDSAYSLYGWMTRLYGLLRVYDQRSRYLGSTMAQCCHVFDDTFIENLANFRAFINQYALKLAAFNVPNTMSLFERHVSLYSNVYKDEDDMKAQYFMFQPAYFYQYDETVAPTQLTPMPFAVQGSSISGNTVTVSNTGMYSFQSLCSYANGLIGALASSEDVGIMSGDILKAYGSNVYKLNMIPEEWAIAPVFNEEILEQLHNANFTGNKIWVPNNSTMDQWYSTFTVKQNVGGTAHGGYLTVQPAIKMDHAHNKILDFWKADVTPEMILTGTRYMFFTAHDGIDDKEWIETSGTEIPMFVSVYYMSKLNPGTLTHSNYYTGGLTYSSSMGDVLAAFHKLNFFNERPIMYIRNAAGKVIAHYMNGELSNYTIINFDDLRKIHDTALLSMLAVPLLGNSNRT